MVEKTDACCECKGTSALCLVVTGPNGIPVSPEWRKKIIGGGRPVTMEAAKIEENPQTVGARLEVDTIRDEVEEMRGVANGLCRREAKGPDEPDYPTNESVVTPSGRDGSEHAESKKGGIFCNVGTTAVLRVNVAGRHGEALLDTEDSKSFIRQDAFKCLKLKVRRPSEECMFTVVNSEPMHWPCRQEIDDVGWTEAFHGRAFV
ncbi:hypothetical protein EPH_0051700 [Eimeria praecox]|uniref:Uncharacterized protein n=1 Tax=Eimeria praecox TaxID=51316 RepID=U6H787_9EIME|nr:hypothetical protein EPH_0051700 [Eimeria praecox]